VAKPLAAAMLAFICLIGLPWRHDSKAQQLRMTIPADDTQYLDVIVSADNRGAQKITYRDNSRNNIGTWKGTDWQSEFAMLSFPISSIPNNAKLESCKIRLVVSENIPPPSPNAGYQIATLLRLHADPSGSFQTKKFVQKATIDVDVDKGVEQGQPLVFSHPSLCRVIETKRNETSSTALVVQFFLSTAMKNRAVAVYMRDDSAPSVRPRLMLSYTPGTAPPGDADWTQIRHDAQHSGRSAWKMYDNPAGDFSDFKNSPLAAPKLISVLQSPLLYGGMVVAAKEDPFSIVALDQKGNQLPGMQSKAKDQSTVTKYLAAAPNGLLYDAMEKSIEALDLRRSLTGSIPENVTGVGGGTRESLVNVPTIGSDGSLYIVTGTFVRAYSPPPIARELWRYPTGQGKLSAVTLSEDEGTAYVLFGPGTGTETGQNRIVALDAATGACRWTSKMTSTAPAVPVSIIVQNQNNLMPNPVVAGQDIYFTNKFPQGDKLYAFRDKDTMLEPAEPENCDKRPAPGKTYNAAGPTPLAGRGKEAIYLNQGQLCWARDLEAEVCWDVGGCAKEDLKKITLMIGDNSDIPNAMRFYGIDPENDRLFAMKATYVGEPKRLAATCRCTSFKSPSDSPPTCRSAAVQNLGPNLILGPDGTLYNSSNEGKLLAIAPSGWSLKGNAGDILTLTPTIVGMTKQDCTKGDGPRGPNDGTAFLAEKIVTDSDLCLPPGTDIILSAAKTIGFRSGFTVKAGARLRAKVGIVQ
jgi:outer membrane protein assembly factor BamB